MITKFILPYLRVLPLHFHSALQNWTLDHLRRWPVLWTTTPKYHKYWSKNPRDRFFDAIPNAFYLIFWLLFLPSWV